jgi:hypothetical protein
MKKVIDKQAMLASEYESVQHAIAELNVAMVQGNAGNIEHKAYQLREVVRGLELQAREIECMERNA